MFWAFSHYVNALSTIDLIQIENEAKSVYVINVILIVFCCVCNMFK